jgi:hypothetical protein
MRTMANPYQTKAGNYLLRSTRKDDLIDLMILVYHGRVAVGLSGGGYLIGLGNVWAGNCDWGIRALESHGLVAVSWEKCNGREWYKLTSEGYAALSGALTKLGRVYDPDVLIARVDSNYYMQ